MSEIIPDNPTLQMRIQGEVKKRKIKCGRCQRFICDIVTPFQIDANPGPVVEVKDIHCPKCGEAISFTVWANEQLKRS